MSKLKSCEKCVLEILGIKKNTEILGFHYLSLTQTMVFEKYLTVDRIVQVVQNIICVVASHG